MIEIQASLLCNQTRRLSADRDEKRIRVLEVQADASQYATRMVLFSGPAGKSLFGAITV
jgi:hypothetical protein